MNNLATRLFFIFLFSSGYILGISQNQKEITFDGITEKQAYALVNELSNTCWSLRESNSDSALIIGKNALQLATKYGFSKEIPKLSGFIGVILIHYLYDIRGSIPYFQESLKGSLEVNDSIRIGYSYNNLGDVYMLTGNVPLALQFSEKSLEIFSNIDNKMGIAYGYINMGLIYRNEKRYDLAIEYFQKARNLRKEIGDSTGFASSLLEIAKTHQLKGNIDLAMNYFNQSFDKHVEINNKRYTAFCLNGIGGLNYLQGEYDIALQNYMDAIILNESRMSYFGLIENYIGIALVYAKQNKILEGEAALNNALEISTRLGLHSKILEVYESFAEFYQLVDDYKKATSSLSKFLVLYDSIYSVQQFEILYEIETNFEIRQSLDKTKQELLSQRNEQIYLIIIIVLMVVIVAFFFWRIIVQRSLNRKLTIANRTKDSLFSVISHDLRSPFNTIIGFNELLLEELNHSDNETAKQYATAVNTVSKDTLSLVNNLLTWSRSQSGTIRFSPVSNNISDLFNELSNFFQSLINNYGLELNFSNSIQNKVSFDYTIVSIVLSNLISNAIKFTRPGGEISISSTMEGEKVSILVKDTGVGMDKSKLKNLFSDYSKTESTVGVRNEKGTGIGLMICMELINIHKGTIIADSKEGEGSTFTIVLPT